MVIYELLSASSELWCFSDRPSGAIGTIAPYEYLTKVFQYQVYVHVRAHVRVLVQVLVRVLVMSLSMSGSMST
jgi:hypothetical protein